jgi:hypothetical protein
MDTTLIARRLQDPQMRKAFTQIHGSYRDIGKSDLDCDYLLCTHTLMLVDTSSLLPEIRRVIEAVKAGRGQRLAYQEMNSEPLHCFQNVLDAVEQDGGCMKTGWLVSAFKGWAGVDLCWHAAWERPEGDVVEVTPGYQRCVFVPSDILPPTAFTARTFSSIEELGLSIVSKIDLALRSQEHQDNAFMLQSGMPVDLNEAVRRAKVRALQQTLTPKKSRFKQRKRRR